MAISILKLQFCPSSLNKTSISSSSSSFFSINPSFLSLKTLHTTPAFTKIFAYSSNDIKVGANIEVDGAPWKVIEFLHVKPGKGAAYVRTTLKNHVTGNSVEKTFRAGSKIELADIVKEVKQYTYKDGAQYVFMDLMLGSKQCPAARRYAIADHLATTYEEVRLNAVDVGDKAKWLKEGMDCILLFWKGKVIDFDLPITIKLTVVEVDPGLKGDTAQGGSKPATVETGAIVNVPLFVEKGQAIMIDSRTGQYMSRA